MLKQSIPFLGLILILGCSDSNDADSDLAAMQREEIEAFIEENSLEATRDDDGFYFTVVEENADGRTQSEGSVLSIYYSMSILGGQEISFFRAENGDPLKLNQGANAVVPVGLDMGINMMREGETYRFILPSALAFQDLEVSGLIPANSIIDLEVQLVNIENEADILANELVEIGQFIGDNSLNDLDQNPLDSIEELESELRYKRIAEGSDNGSPGNGQMVSITYTASFLNGNQFDAVTAGDGFMFGLGSGEVIQGLNEGVSLMENGERALLIMPSQLGYGESVRVIPDFLIDEMITRQVIPDYVARVGPYQVLVFDVTLRQ